MTRHLRSKRSANAAPIDIAMFCHSSLNEHVSTTTAGRLRAVIGTPCFPFSISQQQGASTFTALQLASDLLIAEPEIHTILIVAAEKWCSPFSRWTDQGIVQGDAAGAILVERSRTVASLGLPARCLFTDNFARVAHVTVSDPFINLADCDDLVSGKPFLLCARGVGGFSAAALFVR
ncbi:hypothetical protein [Burkholderia sp. Bp8990]|uniref:hypothetical protein n=1 Tax=Burkholderia sp. Bp8990 TaxID=2184552 RepID=UPI0039089E40